MDVLILLVLLALALGVALALQSATQVPVTPATPLLVLGYPHGWVGFKGVCYYFSRDYGTWEQGQEWCSQLGASLVIAKDEEAMDLLSRLCGNGNFCLGLCRRVSACSGRTAAATAPGILSSAIPSVCTWLTNDERCRRDNCSNEWPYVCSKAQAPL